VLNAWRKPTRTSAGLAHVLVLVQGVMIARAALAQDVVDARPPLDLRPSVSITQVYDSNLLSTPSDHRADFITRVSPAIDYDYRSTIWTLVGRYSVDAERFANSPEFTALGARQHATIGFEYRPTLRVKVAADTEFFRTRTPGELNTATGLALTRATADQVVAHASITRQFDPLTGGTIEYALTDGSLGGSRTQAHGLRIGAKRKVSPRDTVSLDYALDQFLFATDRGPRSTPTSQTLGVGVSHSITDRASIALAGGPRITSGSPAADLSATLHYQAQPADLSLWYARTETAVIGLSGVVSVQSVTATASCNLGPVQIRVAPAVFRSMEAGHQAEVYRLGLGVTRSITRNLSLDIAVDDNLQYGNLYVDTAFPHGTISRHQVLVRFTAAPVNRLTATPINQVH
jgi:hypothetical protein